MKVITPEQFLAMDENEKGHCLFHKSGELVYDQTYFACYKRSSGDVIKNLKLYIEKHGMNQTLLRVIRIQCPDYELA